MEGLPAAATLAEIAGRVDTVTVYIGPRHIGPLIADIVAARPRRVILNPGTESAELERTLDEHGIPYLEACTLVLLGTGQFETALAPAGSHTGSTAMSDGVFTGGRTQARDARPRRCCWTPASWATAMPPGGDRPARATP